MPPLVARASAAHLRIARAHQWLASREPAEEVLVVAASADAANDLLRGVVAAGGSSASFGWYRATLGRLAATLAAPVLAKRNLSPVGGLASEAVMARAVQAVRGAGGLGRYAEVADGPGFSRAASAALAELRLARQSSESLSQIAPDLQRLHAAYEAELERASLVDRSQVLGVAEEVARDSAGSHALLGLPTLLLDLPLANVAECQLVDALLRRAPEALVTLASGDALSKQRFEEIAELELEDLDEKRGTSSRASSLERLQRHLFEASAPPEADLDEHVAVLSAPGEGRECVEIARRLRQLAGEGVPFDQMAVLLRSSDEYRPHLEEALGRAGIPAHFSRGAVRPDPTGRAMLALLHCAREQLSARRFAEYLSLGEVPDASASGDPPLAQEASERWVAPDEELVLEVVAEALGDVRRADGSGDPASVTHAEADPDGAADPETRSVTGGNLRAPWRWERLLVDASVIGGLDRWERRLLGWQHELELDLEVLDDPGGPAAERIARNLADLASLRAFALPLLADLDGLPRHAIWEAWLDALSALATRALRRPERVLAVLGELAPMASVGPVDLDEVIAVLSSRLQSLFVPPAAQRYGRVFIGPAEAARGLSFEVVFVPGLAEKLFPRKIAEEPILLDSMRRVLGEQLVTNEQRVARERQALRLAVGASRRGLVLSYPRLDLEQSRPRVPSFYMLESLRAAEGRLPGFDELATRAETLASVRVGWPAPDRPEDAIDEAEHDLALLEGLRGRDPRENVGTARYLLTANPHLGRALRFRARRWLKRWTVADGLVDPVEPARKALALHALSKRSFSATALQNYTSCPYKFFLHAVLRLSAREEPEAIEELSPLQRGSLVHDVQFQLFSRLRDEGLLPVRPENLDAARRLLDEALDEVAAKTRDQLAPAIDRVWEDGVATVRADLREWLLRASRDDSGFVPWRFELSFGLAGRRESDPHSREDPVPLECGIALRGSIDLVERDATGRLRVTDHKTGKDRVPETAVIWGGQSLQPVLYAEAMESLEPGAEVESGRLYFCTSAGSFSEREVPLDRHARQAAQDLADVIGSALDDAFLPAMPQKDACRLCDYEVVCGPYEELRTSRKPEARIAALSRLREIP